MAETGIRRDAVASVDPTERAKEIPRWAVEEAKKLRWAQAQRLYPHFYSGMLRKDFLLFEDVRADVEDTASALAAAVEARDKELANLQNSYHNLHLDWHDKKEQLATLREALKAIEVVTNDPSQWDLWKIICQVHSDADAALRSGKVRDEAK